MWYILGNRQEGNVQRRQINCSVTAWAGIVRVKRAVQCGCLKQVSGEAKRLRCQVEKPLLF